MAYLKAQIRFYANNHQTAQEFIGRIEDLLSDMFDRAWISSPIAQNKGFYKVDLEAFDT